MAEPFDPYRVLGVPVGASRREIKRRYRRLLRQYHPDVAEDPERAHAIAAELGRAYRMLMDDAVRWRLEQEYYSVMDPELEVVVEQADPARSPVPRLLARARQLLQRGDLDGVQLVCSEVLAYDPDCAEAYSLLAQVHAREGRREMAREMREMAERLRGMGTAPFRQAAARAPSVDREEPPPRPRTSRIWVPAPPVIRWEVLAGTVMVAGGLTVWAIAVGGETWNLIGVPSSVLALGLAAAFVMGAGLAASGVVATFDQELGMDIRGGGPAMPLWLLVLASCGVFAPLGVAAHLVAALLNESLSRSLPLFWSSMALLSLVLFGWTEATPRFLWLGANLICIAGLIGWGMGSMFSPREWWR